MSEDHIITLLEEIKELQKQQLELSQKSLGRYEQEIKNHDKEVGRAKKAQIGFIIVLTLFFLFILYIQWFSNGNPKPSWMR